MPKNYTQETVKASLGTSKTVFESLREEARIGLQTTGVLNNALQLGKVGAKKPASAGKLITQHSDGFGCIPELYVKDYIAPDIMQSYNNDQDEIDSAS
jgi:hypothetical protein